MLVITLLATFATAQEEGQWNINLDNVPFTTFMRTISDITGDTYVVDPAIEQNVTVVSSSPITADAVQELLFNVLRVNSLTLARSRDGMMVITPKLGAPQAPAEENGLGVVTRIITITHHKAEEVMDSVLPMISDIGNISPAYFANAIIVTDYSPNVARIHSVLKNLDTNNQSGSTRIMLKQAWVGDVVPLLQELFQHELYSENGSGNQLRIIGDEVNNALLLSGTQTVRNNVAKAIALLDRKDGRTAATKVVYLQHASAVDVAEILKEFLPQIASEGSSEVAASVQADKSINSLIIKANPSLLAELENIIAKLDIRRAQVHIEAAIVEVTNDIGSEFGVQYALGDSARGNYEGGTVAANTIGQSIIGAVNALATGSVPFGQVNGVSLGKISQGDFGVLLQALASSNNANLLSTPSITTLDNKEASIVIGQNVPFRTGTFTNDNGDGNPFTTIERRDVGIKLTVVPRIHDGNIVRLQIEQEVSSVAQESTSSTAADLITNTRTIKTTVLADDLETIVLGGLIEDDIAVSESKVPLLGDIPVVGELFSSTRENRVKRNLLVFLRPTIMRDSISAGRVNGTKYQNFQEYNNTLDQSSILGTRKPSNIPPVDSLYDGTYRTLQQAKPLPWLQTR